MFELAKMGGKEDKMGYINPLLRQGLGSGTSNSVSFHSFGPSLRIVNIGLIGRGRASGSFPGIGRIVICQWPGDRG